MELWVRSQDKMKLCNAKVFSLDNDQTGIFCNSCEDSYVFVGKYKSKERAIEVLDEIHQRLIDLQTLNYTNDYRFSKGRNLDCVFIMPED